MGHLACGSMAALHLGKNPVEALALAERCWTYDPCQAQVAVRDGSERNSKTWALPITPFEFEAF